MKSATVLIAGAGPAGAACARQLKKHGIDFIILDKAAFPREKPCAGWISPGVFMLLESPPDAYPHSLHRFNKIVFHFPKWKLPVKTRQYSIKRWEFDNWLLESADIQPVRHEVKQIKRDGEFYIIDESWKGRFLVGAGGTHCPVHSFLFPNSRLSSGDDLIIGLATEAAGASTSPDCHLWFFENGISGYSWYLPKGDGTVNLGIGARANRLKANGETIIYHWQLFAEKLQKLGWVAEPIPHPRGHYYYLQAGREIPSGDNIFLIGDSARVSTLDMGEGIYNSIKSGKAVAEVIARELLSGEKTREFPGDGYPEGASGRQNQNIGNFSDSLKQEEKPSVFNSGSVARRFGNQNPLAKVNRKYSLPGILFPEKI
ncbi:MAG: geranylgeranyl reductase family protein [Calditrichia bacterium]